jgi:hypothetical protein
MDRPLQNRKPVNRGFCRGRPFWGGQAFAPPKPKLIHSLREWYHPSVRCSLQRPILKSGGVFAPFLTGSILIVLVCVFLAGVGEVEAHRDADTAPLLHADGQGIPLKVHVNPANNASRSIAGSLGNPYLMLVNTAVATQMDAPKLAQFDRSPYNALAVSFADAFDTFPVLALSPMQAQMERWKKSTTKDIWPWVYLNRMIGANEAEGNQYAKVRYFQRIQGLDLAGKAGAQNDFLENWRNALRLAKQTGVPGIVCDLEFYNNYKAYDLAELARMISQPPEEVLNLLKQLGTSMADIAAKEYPQATLWFLFTGFPRTDYRVIDGRPYYLAATYIVEGLLDEIRRHHSALHVLSGGEVGLGYCHASVEDLRQAIEKRAAAFAPILQKYKGILELAGTITLWSDQSAKKDWVAQGACGTSTAATVEDLIPFMELLFRAYRYNWLYGSPNGGYFAFQPTSAPRFDAAISQAKQHAFETAGGQPLT